MLPKHSQEGAIPKFLYMAFYSLTSILLPMTFIFLGSVWSVIVYTSEFASEQLVLAILVCLLTFVLFNAMGRRIGFIKFWILSYILFIPSYALFFMVDLIFDHQKTLLTAVSLLLIGLISLVLTIAWKEIIVKKKYNKSYLLILPVIIDIFLIKWDIFIPFGQWLNAVTSQSINIFFLDWGGFTILYLNTINALIVFVLLAISRISSTFDQQYA